MTYSDDIQQRCGCHKSCHTDPHECEKPCRWPACMTDDEAREYRDEPWPQHERDLYWDGWKA